jgi:hypothetical protein
MCSDERRLAASVLVSLVSPYSHSTTESASQTRRYEKGPEDSGPSLVADYKKLLEQRALLVHDLRARVVV